MSNISEIRNQGCRDDFVVFETIARSPLGIVPKKAFLIFLCENKS